MSQGFNNEQRPGIKDERNIETTSSASTDVGANSNNSEHGEDLEISRELTPPPLPPRPSHMNVNSEGPPTPSGTLRISKNSPRPQLLSKATTAVSKTDIHKESESSTLDTPSPKHGASSRSKSYSKTAQQAARDADDNASIRSFRSFAPSRNDGGDIESLIGDIYGGEDTSDWGNTSLAVDDEELFRISQRDEQFESHFESEFADIGGLQADGSNEEQLTVAWKSKLKHFLILSSAGKPIYSRHGEDSLISNSIGVIRTIISFYQDAEDTLKGFTAGDARFVVLSKGHLHLVAISRLGESDLQLRNQLEALYLQILSTLTLPKMEKMFLNRPSADLRRPLEGTETLLSSLADTFTRGSPSTLLSALECLPMRKSDRAIINNAILTTKSPNLLYGLLVAGGRLASVLRPKKHSLHPGDLQLIFNMLFEASSVRRGGGENWIPLCLPGFNNTGYLYMYVSFLAASDEPAEDMADTTDNDNEHPPSTPTKDDEIAILLISANKESFFELRKMRNSLVAQLSSNGSMAVLQAAISKGRISCGEIVPTRMTPQQQQNTDQEAQQQQPPTVQHFLYKSRPNVQFTMPTASPAFATPLAWRRLMSLYASLHAAGHGRAAGGAVKVHHRSGRRWKALAWVTPVFELYVVADAGMARGALAQAAERLLRWVQREEDRLFIIGGAVF